MMANDGVLVLNRERERGLLWVPMSPRLYAKFGDIGRYWAILEKIFKIHGDIRRHWAILGDIGRY